MPTTETHNVRTAHGTIHRLTAGRAYTHRGYPTANKAGSKCGKADCGALTSAAARVTDEPVNCPKCRP
jgi:hypothetical protein